MKKLLYILPLLLFLFSMFSPVSILAAENVNLCPPGSFGTLCNSSVNVNSIVRSGIQILFIIAVIAATIFLIWGGIKWITSGGDKAKVEEARNTIIGAVIGLIVTFAAYFILNIVATMFGLGGNIFDLQLPSFVGNGGGGGGSDTACYNGQPVNQPPGCTCTGTVTSGGYCILN